MNISMKNVNKYTDTCVKNQKFKLFSFQESGVLLRLIKLIFTHTHTKNKNINR